MSFPVYVALGSNLGDRKVNIDGALQMLRAHPAIRVIKFSSYYETDPVGGPPGQGKYLNAAAQLDTSLSPEELLQSLLDIEAKFGRTRGELNAPRTLDLDLLIYNDLVRLGPDPILPHPRMHLRSFVLDPLAEIAPDARHPSLGVTFKRLAQNVRPVSPPGLVLAGKRALVTGSTSGIGRAIAEVFAAAGAWVIVHGRNVQRADAIAGALRRQDVASTGFSADFREPTACRQLADSAWNLWDGLDIVVCNAGADTLTGDAAEWPFERKLAELWSVDVQATILLTRWLGTKMKEHGRGVILTMGWDQAETGIEGDSGQLFAAAKSAVMGYSRSLALTLAPEVRVNCLAPGWIKTAWGERASGQWQERVRRETPLQRWGTPEDVAKAALWLASPGAEFITGQIIRINGGAVR
jgi:2-amino-4-hydroxy-6-hydroxymethyldihydropteridine diphosphokinase